MKNLFLDDDRKPKQVYADQDPENWHLVTTYKEFCDYLDSLPNTWDTKTGDTSNMPKVISFDFVLAEDETGMDCARYLADFCIKHGLELPKINVHSSYPNASMFIRDGLRKYAQIDQKRIEINLISHNA